ncbi:MAG TPA: bifunctional DNA-formamidopyrimidine glycosylase/DNA-(apurinic or apyrimidinic site) lyase [Verrucomicrobiae bacterium]|nr:bifunctional DNA-formamidopyrimidine glycosylase/DNA-(apurinic or apyrimidinic site) lyase [Verrucomicrobiae bacterium]
MPELPEVEVLARHLGPLIAGKRIRKVTVRRARVLRPTTPRQLQRTLTGARFDHLIRRGKYLVFGLTSRNRKPIPLLGHLGMTGRMYLLPRNGALPKHAAVVLDLGAEQFVYEDARYFGRLTLDTSAMAPLGPEPLGNEFTIDVFADALARSPRAIKIKLLDQELVAGIGNIYASEALYLAGISPQLPANRLSPDQIKRLHRAIRKVLTHAIHFGSTIPLNHSGKNGDGLFYFGLADDAPDFYEERLRVYDRGGQPCSRCRTPIRRIVQAARSTFFCPQCQIRSRR